PLMSAATTLAPSRTNAFTDAFAIPDPAPVMTATLPSSIPIRAPDPSGARRRAPGIGAASMTPNSGGVSGGSGSGLRDRPPAGGLADPAEHLGQPAVHDAADRPLGHDLAGRRLEVVVAHRPR